jgi:mono/diheme cytochrome c family protein
MLRKILKWTGLLILLVVGGVALATALRQHVIYDAPLPDIKASADKAVIAKGRQLVVGAGHCVDCHSTDKKKDSLINAGHEPVLSGGYVFDLPFGKFYTANLTPDSATGIGRRTDAELARALRHGVKSNGEALLPFMPFQNMTDEELTAIISYLRTMKPVHNPVPANSYNVLGSLLKAFMIKPEGPSAPVKKSIKADTTAAYGRHLVMNVATCWECHTKRDGIGKPIGEPMAGGTVFEEPGKSTLISPNLTPDPASGRIYNWSEELFIKRFRMGRLIKHSHMPWDAYSRMSDNELKAIHKYLKSLKPVNTSGPAK